MAGYIQVAEEEGEETIELPTEEDGTLLLSTLQAQFPGTSGLKYRPAESNAARGIRLTEGHLHPPPGDDGWGSHVFFCVFPKENSVAENKRKRDDNLENSTAKTKRMESRLKCTDLIVLGKNRQEQSFFFGGGNTEIKGKLLTFVLCLLFA